MKLANSKESGFTLLEVIVAVSILAVSVAVSMQIFSQGFKNIHRVELAHRAMSHAENLMHEFLADASIREPTQLSGDLDEDFDYQAEINYWDDPDLGVSLDSGVEPPMYLLSVRVNVRFKNHRQGKMYRASCLKAVSTRQPGEVASPADAIQRLFGSPGN